MLGKPRYLWLSIIAFLIISYQCRNAILHNGKEREYGLLLRYLGFELLWGMITLIIPAGVMVLIMHITAGYSSTIENIINVIGLIYLYFGGVIFASKLYGWKNKNIV